MLILPLLPLYAPVAFLAFWHRWDWGGTFAWDSELWTWSARLAAVLLAGMTLLLMWAPAGHSLPFLLCLQMGLGFGIAIFPGAACSLLSSHYKALAAINSTNAYAVVGWSFILIGGVQALGAEV